MNATARIIQADSRTMVELEPGSIDLAVTSPPYWHLKDYTAAGQIGYGQTLHAYLKDLHRVWTECFRVLRPGARLCINIGDQFARSVIYGRYKVIPLHAEIIAQAERIGFDFMGSIIWQKKTTMNTTGGATVMGSFPYPPNGIVEIDYEYIHILKKPGGPRRADRRIREASKLTTEQWKQYFTGHWAFGGARQIDHEAMFPEELPARLIRMFSFIGDTVLDPFLGSGTTARAALDLGRRAVGYEINPDFLPTIRRKLGVDGRAPKLFTDRLRFEERTQPAPLPEPDYEPRIQDARPQVDPKKLRFRGERLYRVIGIAAPDKLELDTGLIVRLLGVRVARPDAARDYYQRYIIGKQVSLEFDESNGRSSPDEVEAYVYLKNRIFINGYLIRSGLARPDRSRKHRLQDRFAQFEKRTAEADRQATGPARCPATSHT